MPSRNTGLPRYVQQVSLSLRALATGGLAALIAASVAFSPYPIWLVFPLLAILVAVGWGQLLRLPDAMTVNIIVGTAGLAFVLIAFFAPRADVAGLLALALAVAVMLAFFSQMLRDPRPRLVETVGGILTGVTVQLGVAAWVLAARALWHQNPAEFIPGNLGFTLVLPFALVLAGCGLFGTALIQNWPGNPDARLPLWQRRRATGAAGAGAILPGLATAAAIVAVWGFAPYLLGRLLGQ